MMKKLIYILLSSAVIIIATACSQSVVKCETDLMVEESARRDAEAVVAAKGNIYEQEDAVLSIRARENELRDAGFDHEADLYIQTIGHILIDSLHIISPCH